MSDILKRPVLIDCAGLRAVELGPPDAEGLQAFYEANPGYFQRVTGEPPSAHEALDDLSLPAPADLVHGHTWHLGWVDAAGRVQAYAALIQDFGAPGVWHIGLYMIDHGLEGQGMGARLHGAMADWARGLGARWLRVDVVVGNRVAERFWGRQGYAEVRRRAGILLGRQLNTMAVQVLALRGGTLLDYLDCMPRDDVTGYEWA